MMKRLFVALSVTAVTMPWSASAQQAPAADPNATLFERLRTEQRNVELQKIAPFKVFDDFYYVGVGFVGAWLINTGDGLVLIDSLQEPYIDHLIDDVRTLGFDPKDIKYVLVTHSHLDHYGGARRIQETYGAKVAMIEGDWKALEDAAATNRSAAFVPRKDVVFKDGDTFTLGRTSMRFYATPGHTPGGLSIEQTVYDHGKPYKAFTIGGVTPTNQPGAAEAFNAAIDRISTIPGIQVNLPNHPWRGDVLERGAKLAARKPGDPHPFVDSEAFGKLIKDLRAEAVGMIAKRGVK